MNAVCMAISTIGEFVRQEMKNREIRSNREFARVTDINHQIINDLVNDKARELEISTLVKLSNYTATSIMTLIALAFPEALNVEIDTQFLLDAEKISKLPPEKRAIARGYIADAYAQRDDQ